MAQLLISRNVTSPPTRQKSPTSCMDGPKTPERRLRKGGDSSRMTFVVAIAGCTRSGKTSCAVAIKSMFDFLGQKAEISHMDNFFKDARKMPEVRLSGQKRHQNFELPQSIDLPKMTKAIREALSNHTNQILIVEGFLLFSTSLNFDLLEVHTPLKVFLKCPKEVAKFRRCAIDKSQSKTYFERVTWKSYLAHGSQCPETAACIEVGNLDSQQQLSAKVCSLVKEAWEEKTLTAGQGETTARNGEQDDDDDHDFPNSGSQVATAVAQVAAASSSFDPVEPSAEDELSEQAPSTCGHWTASEDDADEQMGVSQHTRAKRSKR